jgi:hypothetical protein
MTQKKPGNPQLLLRLPAELKSALQELVDQKSKKEDRVVTVQEVILDILATRCKIIVKPPARGRSARRDD